MGTQKRSPNPHSLSGWAAPAGLSLPQLILLDEAALVFIQDVEHLLYVIRALFLQADHLEELFVVEGVDSCGGGVERSELKRGQRRGSREGQENGGVKHLFNELLVRAGGRGMRLCGRAEGAQTSGPGLAQGHPARGGRGRLAPTPHCTLH